MPNPEQLIDQLRSAADALEKEYHEPFFKVEYLSHLNWRVGLPPIYNDIYLISEDAKNDYGQALLNVISSRPGAAGTVERKLRDWWGHDTMDPVVDGTRISLRVRSQCPQIFEQLLKKLGPGITILNPPSDEIEHRVMEAEQRLQGWRDLRKRVVSTACVRNPYLGRFQGPASMVLEERIKDPSSPDDAD